jgi:hypothetical protein
VAALIVSPGMKKLSGELQALLRDCRRTLRHADRVLRKTRTPEIAQIETAAIEIANRVATNAGKKLSNYRRPKLAFYAIQPNGQWSAFYTSRSRSRSKDSFYIVIDAKTNAAKLVTCD